MNYLITGFLIDLAKASVLILVMAVIILVAARTI